MSVLYKNHGQISNFFILSDKKNDTFFSNIIYLKNTFNHFSVQFIQVDSAIFDYFPINEDVSAASYYRLMIGELLPENITRALYLDCDTIATNNFTSLFDVDMGEAVILAVADYFDAYHAERLNFPNGRSYFNSGLMMIDLEKWRREDIVTNALRFIRKNREIIQFADQDILNALLQDKWKPLGIEFNFQNKHARDWEMGKLDADPKIVHFTGKMKPWKKDSNHPFKHYYWNYLRSSPYHKNLSVR
jgi:UDP-glucose/galactose:(glucosyl)LPS alpha-1,2-glucosyl/galactosyltransferase